MREQISTSTAPLPSGPYSQCIRSGGFLFLAGQVGQDPATRELPEGFEARVRRTFENLEAIATAAGARLVDAISVRVALEDLSNLATFNELYEEYFSEPYPVRTTVQAGLGGLSVEVDAVIALAGT